MKPFAFKNYGSIPHLSSSKLGIGDHFIESGQERILTEKARDKHDIIYVFEKYDGSNVGVAKVNGKLVALTRSGYLAETSPYKQHHLFAKWVRKNEDRFAYLKEGERLVGEWLAQVHSIQYKFKSHDHPIVWFDYFGADNKRKKYDDFQYLCDFVGLELARLLHIGEPTKPETLIEKLNRRSTNANAIEPPEGMIYRCERHGKVDFLAKWVRPDFEAGKYLKNEIWNI